MSTREIVLEASVFEELSQLKAAARKVEEAAERMSE